MGMTSRGSESHKEIPAPGQPAGQGPTQSPSAGSDGCGISPLQSEDDLFRDPFADFAPSGR
jgi:hypothetical protein